LVTYHNYMKMYGQKNIKFCYASSIIMKIGLALYSSRIYKSVNTLTAGSCQRVRVKCTKYFIYNVVCENT
jgi:hypothetical protein